MDELFNGQGIGSMTTSKELESMAQLPAPGSRQFPISGSRGMKELREAVSRRPGGFWWQKKKKKETRHDPAI